MNDDSAIAKFTADQIAEQWINYKALENVYRENLLREQQNIGEMINNRDGTLDQISNAMHVSRQYVHQLQQRVRSGWFDARQKQLEPTRKIVK